MKTKFILLILCLLPVLTFAQNYEHRGDSLYATGQYEKALKQYNAAIEISGQDSSIQAKIAKTRQKIEDSKHHYLKLNMVGNIGTSHGTLEYDEHSDKGYYTYKLSNTTVKRNITLSKRKEDKIYFKSYDLSGKYIGEFDGILKRNNNQLSYSGTFTNYKGVSVKFQLKQ